MTTVETGKIYLLEEFSLEPEKRVLSRDGKQSRLSNRPFQVLLYLIENRDRIVTRRELLEKFWNGHDVYDAAVTKCVGAVRKALDDLNDSPRFIETRWGEGYRFIGQIKESATLFEENEKQCESEFFTAINGNSSNGNGKLSVESQESGVENQLGFQISNFKSPNGNGTSEKRETINEEYADGHRAANNKRVSEDRRPKTTARKTAIVFIALAGAVAVGFLVVQFIRPLSQTVTTNQPAAPINSIAVLPFKNLTGNAEREIFTDGMTESLIGSLSKIENLKVISRNSVFTFKGKDADPREVGKQLGVATVLEGSVRENVDKIRVEVRLVNAADGQILWSGENYDHALGDVFEIQDEIARNVTTNLRLKLSPADEQRLTKRQTINIEAYQHYLKAMNYRNQLKLPEAIEAFNEALRLAPDYAPAHEGLAVVYALMEFNSQVPPGSAAPLAEFQANRALELDENSVGAYLALGVVKTLNNYDLNERIRYYREAIRRNPNYLTAHRWLSSTLLAQGKFEEAEAELLYVQEIDPLSYGVRLNLAELYYYWRKPDKTIEQANLMLVANPDNVEAHSILGKAYLQKGMLAEAAAEFQKFAPNAPQISILMATGRIAEARKAAENFAVGERAKTSPYAVGCYFAGIGDKEKALVWLEKSYELRQADLVSMKIDPAFDGLRDDARFQDLLRRVGL